MTTIDLTQRAPRSPRVRIGGFVILARMLDKGRAVIAKTNGEYKFACPLDQHFLTFVDIDPQKVLEQLQAGKGDGEVLEYILANCKRKPLPQEITAWSQHFENRAPGDVDSRQFLQEMQQKIAPHRSDIVTWFDLLDVDDHVSFSGKA
jgi:Domain of unknown function (DUF5069)